MLGNVKNNRTQFVIFPLNRKIIFLEENRERRNQFSDVMIDHYHDT